ncbi:ImmA/IrrE family metallo-endopeptidase [Mycobacterium nebraskense]|uniref:ImmA/IrrE family metallo-endopeptidase n=1 Tax=Mycobacterium nebraskense TaxID=244292 RepID=UPI0023F2723E|nr:ImmA/IrrE family metallo-endopeptidase [Mycobacterium nebraskense]MBI2692769.1 ImmA/IrrE family metallo-endopeptidase [Mycobacterium nebraskense]
MTRPRPIDALVAAADTLRLLDIDQTRPIDPFAAIDQLGLNLVIADLDNLLGAVLPHGNGGVLITSQRPIGVQRYTAAHEIGHWILHSDQLRLDGHEQILGQPSSQRERQAQLFAAYFLMPPPLMQAAVSRHGLKSGEVRPEQVYLVSRDVDVSYEAATRRLAAMKLIDSTEVSGLLKVTRLNALKRAFDGHRPKDGHADLWRADATVEHPPLPVREGDDVLIVLPENRTTGWQWLDAAAVRRRNNAVRRSRPTAPAADHDTALTDRIDAQYEPSENSIPLRLAAQANAVDDHLGFSDADEEAPLTVVGDEFRIKGDEPTAQGRQRRRQLRAAVTTDTDLVRARDDTGVIVGGAGQRTVAVHCARPGEWTFDLQYTHAYDPYQPPAAEYQLRVQVEPTPNHAYLLRRLSADLDKRLPGDPDDDMVFEVAP